VIARNFVVATVAPPTKMTDVAVEPAAGTAAPAAGAPAAAAAPARGGAAPRR
jgi:hypothetical protein